MTAAVTLATLGNGPAFSAYLSANQAAPTIGVATKINFDAEEFDTNNNFAAGRFTPTVAGYYQLNFNVYLNTNSSGLMTVYLYKNGSLNKVCYGTSGANPMYGMGGSSLLYFNGSTDYAEIYVYLSNSTAIYGNISYTYFQGCLVRGA